jgi:hypothetical protein
MSGAIIPDPLTIPATWTVVSPTIALAPAPLGKVSVVQMVSAAASHEQGSAVSAASTPARALSFGSGTPMTPVELTKTSFWSQPRCPATCAMICSTASRPR